MNSLLGLDRQITDFLYYASSSELLQTSVFYLASGVVYLIPVVLLVMFFRSHADRLVAMKVFLSAVFAWQVLSNLLGDWLYGGYGFRDRPFAEMGLQELLFERPEKAFPSDHAAVIAAVVISFFMYRYPKLGYFFLITGVLSSLARVMIGFHWFGDIIGGWLLGAIAAGALWLLNRPATKGMEWVVKKFSREYGRR